MMAVKAGSMLILGAGHQGKSRDITMFGPIQSVGEQG